MAISQKHIELIEGYLNGSLKSADRMIVEEQIASNVEFATRLKEEEVLQSIINSKGDADLLSSIKLGGDYYHKKKALRRRVYWVGAAILSLIVSILIINATLLKPNDVIVELGHQGSQREPVTENKLVEKIDTQKVIETDNGRRDSQDKSRLVNSSNTDKSDSVMISENALDSKFDSIKVANKQVKGNGKQTQEDKKNDEKEVNPCASVLIEGRFGTMLSCSDSASGVIYLKSKVTGGQKPYKYYLNNKESKSSRFEKLGKGSYKLRIKDVNNCSSEVSNIVVGSRMCPLIVNFNVSPQVGEDIKFPVTKNEEGRAQIFNEEGKKIYDQFVKAGDRWDCTINGQTVPAGSYSYTLKKSSGKLITGSINIVP